MLKLKTTLTQTLLGAYYTWNAENHMALFHCVIDVGFLDKELRKVMMKSPEFNPATGTIVLNLSVNACRYIDYTGDCFYGEIAMMGVPTRLHIPYHAFVGVNVQISENTGVFSPFPSVDRLLFEAANPEYVHPFRDHLYDADGHNQVHIDLSDLIAYLESKGETDVTPENATDRITAFFKNGQPDPDFLGFVQTRARERQLKTLEEIEEFITDEPTDYFKAWTEGAVPGNKPEPLGENKPLLDFGDLPGTPVFKGPSRYKGKPTLTVIQGGKK